MIKSIMNNNKNLFVRNIIPELELHNISAMVGVLKVIDEFDVNILKNTFSELLIRGRFEKFVRVVTPAPEE